MPKLRLMKQGHGDLQLDEWTHGDDITTCRARQTFGENFLPGRLAFRMDPSRPGCSEPISEFCDDAEEILIVPAVAGG